MKGKRKAAPDRADASAAQVAKLAQISISRVYRLLQEGRTPAEIIASAQQRRDMFVLRDLPAVPVNGHAAAAGAVSYAQSLAEKEKWAAELRKIEVMEKRRELVPVAYIRHWGGKFLVETRDTFLRIPGELADELAAETSPIRCEALVRGRIEAAMERIVELESLWREPPPEAA